MAYSKQTWHDLPDQTTPINAERLNHMEDGIFNNSLKIVDEYSEAQDKGYSANYINNNQVNAEILWTNPNPTSSFSAQNITLSSDDYDVLEIFYLTHYQKNAVMSVKTPKGKGTILQSIFQHQDSGYAGSREMVYNNPTSVSFVDNVTVVFQQAFNRSANNGWNIPLYIVGYKTGLFS